MPFYGGDSLSLLGNIIQKHARNVNSTLDSPPANAAVHTLLLDASLFARSFPILVLVNKEESLALVMSRDCSPGLER